MHDKSPADAEREEMLSSKEEEFTIHEVAMTEIGDWRLKVQETISDSKQEMLERTWEATRPSRVKGLKDEAEASEDLLSLVEFLVSLMPGNEAERYDCYLIVADLHAQMHTYWKEFQRERDAA